MVADSVADSLQQLLLQLVVVAQAFQCQLLLLLQQHLFTPQLLLHLLTLQLLLFLLAQLLQLHLAVAVVVSVDVACSAVANWVAAVHVAVADACKLHD